MSVHQKEITLFGHGILTLPLTIMLPFGLLGLRPGQLFNKILGCIINLMFFFNYGVILAVTIARIFNVKDYEETQEKFFTGFAVFITIKLTLLIYIYFKRFNFICLLEDITKIRKYSLSKLEVIFITIPFIVVVSMTSYLIFFLSNDYVLPILKTGVRSFDFAFNYNGPLQTRVTIVLEFLVFLNISWISIMATGFIINVIAIVLRREFDKCIENVKEKMNETTIMSSDIFSETVERFQELRNIVQQVDDMFFLDVSLNLCASLGMLCSVIYGIYHGHFNFEEMSIQIVISMVTLLMMLSPSAALHSKVRATFIILHSI